MDRFKKDLNKLIKEHKITTSELQTILRQTIRGNLRQARFKFVRDNMKQCKMLFKGGWQPYLFQPWNKTHVRFATKAKKEIGWAPLRPLSDVFFYLHRTYITIQEQENHK